MGWTVWPQTAGGGRLLAVLAGLGLVSCVAVGPQAPTEAWFGSDTSLYARNGDCDDPRFVGEGMAVILDRADAQRDASDCRKLYLAGKLREEVALRPAGSEAMCANIAFGDNTSLWARDSECDDPRFGGPGVDSILDTVDLQRDAADCKAACAAGTIWLK